MDNQSDIPVQPDERKRHFDAKNRSKRPSTVEKSTERRNYYGKPPFST